jgi:alkylation response protein AidB-like acyl-CoA dehydrogenase
MPNLLVDERDQKFVLHEMLRIEELAQTPLYGHLSRDVIDASLDAASKLAVKESYPTMAEADREGCRLKDGNVYAPRCFHRLKEHYDKGKWSSVHVLRENGGQGFPLSLWASLNEGFMHNAAFIWLWATPLSSSSLIAALGSQEQKEKYLENTVSGKWGSALAANEDTSGCDVALQRTVAVRQPDGSYRIKGTKSHVTNGDSDLFENIIQVVLARIEGDPANETGLSLFLVPKYLVNGDGSLGPRNDYAIVGIERKLGLNGNPTCSINYGENGNCHAELIGGERQGMGILLQALKSGYLCCTTMATGIASTAYLHALDHAKKRIQGAHIAQVHDLDAPRVAILAHPDVRRMLLWMKSQVEGMRALLYYGGLCMDKAQALSDPTEREKWSGLMDLLLPICRIYSADTGFKVTETAIQVHGRYGYFNDYPIQQFLRDIKPASIWEIATGVHALLFVAQTMGQRDGQDFVNLLQEMHHTIGKHRELGSVQDLVRDVEKRVNLLGEMGLYFASCAKEGKILVPICNATPFAHFMGNICVGWLLFWEACIATKRLTAIFEENHIDPLDAAEKSEFLSKNQEAAFYDGKVNSARFFIKNVLPQVDGIVAAIKNEDLSLMTIHDDGF